MEYSIENAINMINHSKTKEYFKEVISSFEHKNYRSAVVMLYSVVICDLIYKLKDASEIFNNQTASTILQEIERRQHENPKSPEWERYLIDEVTNTRAFLDTHEAENLKILQKHRHLSAHPVLDQVDILFYPSPETVEFHIRSMVEGILSKGPIMNGDAFNSLLEDLSIRKKTLQHEPTLRQYVGSKYLDHINHLLEKKFFKSLWRIVFFLENQECTDNREINYKVLKYMLERNSDALHSFIETETRHFSNLKVDNPIIIELLIDLLSKNSGLFQLLDAHVKHLITEKIKTKEHLRIKAHFVESNFISHLENLKSRYHHVEHTYFGEKFWINYHVFDHKDIKILEELSREFDAFDSFIEFCIEHFKHSTNFNTADYLFDYCIVPYLHKFNQEQILSLLDAMNSNDQIYNRRQSVSDNKIVKTHADKLLQGVEYEKRFSNLEFE